MVSLIVQKRTKSMGITFIYSCLGLKTDEKHVCNKEISVRSRSVMGLCNQMCEKGNDLLTNSFAVSALCGRKNALG